MGCERSQVQILSSRPIKMGLSAISESPVFSTWLQVGCISLFPANSFRRSSLLFKEIQEPGLSICFIGTYPRHLKHLPVGTRSLRSLFHCNLARYLNTKRACGNGHLYTSKHLHLSRGNTLVKKRKVLKLSIEWRCSKQIESNNCSSRATFEQGAVHRGMDGQNFVLIARFCLSGDPLDLLFPLNMIRYQYKKPKILSSGSIRILDRSTDGFLFQITSCFGTCFPMPGSFRKNEMSCVITQSYPLRGEAIIRIHELFEVADVAQRGNGPNIFTEE